MADDGASPRLPPSFRWLLAAESASSVGTYVTLLALQTIVVVTLDGTAADTGILSSARWLPYLVVGLLVGALVDRMRRRPVMVWSDLARAALLASIPVLWLVDALTLPALLVVVVAYGCATVVNDAASMAFLPRLVHGAALQRAHARIDTADAVAQTGGPALGGVVIRLVGAPFAVLVDAAASVFAAVAVARIRIDEPAPTPGGRRPRDVGRDIAAGVRFVYGPSGLARLAACTHVWFAANAVLGTVLAPFALDGLGIGVVGFGLVAAAAGIGAVLGASITGALGRRIGAGPAIIVSHALSALGVLVMAASALAASPFAAAVVLAAGQAVHGLAMGLSNSHEMSYRQTRTPDDAQGRVNMTMRAANRAVIVVVAPIAGLAAVLVGVLPMLVVAAAIFALAALGLLASPFRHARA